MRFAAVLSSPTSSRALQVDFVDTYPSSFALHDSDSWRCGWALSLPVAATTRSCVTSPRTVCASGVLPPASASNTAHALPFVRPSSPTAAAGWSETSLRCRLEEPASAINPLGCSQNAEPQPDLIAPKPVAAQPRHLYSLLAFLDPLLCLAALVVEVDDLPVRELRVCHDEPAVRLLRVGQPLPTPPTVGPSGGVVPLDAGNRHPEAAKQSAHTFVSRRICPKAVRKSPNRSAAKKSDVCAGAP